MNARRDRARFRPRFDFFESRQLLSAAPLMGVASIRPTPPAIVAGPVVPADAFGPVALVATNIQMRGKNTAGYWKAGTSQFAIFAVQFDGALTKTNAQEAFDYGKAYVTKRGISLDATSAAGNVRTTSKINVLLGFYDVKRKDGAWIAGTYAGSRNWTTYGKPPWYAPWQQGPPELHTAYKVKYLTSTSSSLKTVEGAGSIRWTTQSGYRITTTLNPVNGAGDIAATFTKPS